MVFEMSLFYQNITGDITITGDIFTFCFIFPIFYNIECTSTLLNKEQKFNFKRILPLFKN